MSTGYPKLDTALFVVGYLLFLVSEALGKSKRFQANGMVQFFCHFVQSGWQGVKASPSGMIERGLQLAGPMIEKRVEAALDTPVPETGRAPVSPGTLQRLAQAVQEQNQSDPPSADDPNGLNRI
jgi:hypothetical protein